MKQLGYEKETGWLEYRITIPDDISERHRTIAEAVMERYQRVLKPMHEQFIETCKRYADVIIPQGGHNNAAINMLVKFIKQELKEKK